MSTPTFRHRTLRERLFGRSARTGMGTSILALPVIGLILFGVGFTFYAPYTNSKTRVCTVEDKDRAQRAKGKSDMRVYTTECGVLAVDDMFLAGEWTSADTYNDIKVGKTYEFTTTGFRVGILSTFPIIRDVQEVAQGAESPVEPQEGVTVGSTLATTDEVNSVPVGTVLRAEGVNFERVEAGFQIVGTTDVKPADYVVSFGPLTVTYLP